jgi:hypothetical protein
MAWLSANWQPLLLAILAIDSALIPLFPNVGLLVKIKNLLSSFGPKPPAAS